ncbi:MAG: hypothetical protein Q8O98_01310 [bacterium]|nr:hypothetical protein [bacterium]
MDIRIASALFASVILIGGASWVRFSNTSGAPAGLAVAESQPAENIEIYNIENTTTISGTAATAPSDAPLTDTGLISRQLILEYVDLAANGQASSANLEALAEKFVNQVPNLNKTSSLGLIDLKVVANSQINFQIYADALVSIQREHGQRISTASAGARSFNTLNSATYAKLNSMAATYANSAERLKALAVPAELAQAHLQLTNSYLSNASAMRAISQADQDSSNAFAGIIILNQNTAEQEAIFAEIVRILNSHGI